MKTEKQWRKILYENQDYPDNYTDKSFLWELKRNIKYEEIKLYEAIIGASVVNQELCTVVSFVLIYVYMYNEWLDPSNMFYVSSAATVAGFIIYRLSFNASLKNENYGIRTVLIFLVFGHLFSPLLHTLTNTISTNTIYTMTFFMMLVHLIFFDYGVPAAVMSNSLSLSAAVFGSICLASRLASTYHAFVLITVAVEIFVLFPIFRTKIRRSVILSVVLIGSAVVTLSLVSKVITIILVFVIAVINIVCPLLFIRYQKCKDNIYGPWDEAIVEDADNINDLIYS